MHDDWFDRLAKLLVEYSIRLKRNETVLIEAFDIPDEMTVALIRAVRKAGGVPFAQTYQTRVNRALALEASDRQLNLMASHELARMKKMNAYIAVRGSNNITELSDVPPDKMKLIGRKMRPVQDQRVKKNQGGSVTLADSFHGAACWDEHRGIRRLLFRCVHAGL